MPRILTRIGWALVLVGIFFATPLSDFLPVDLFAELAGLFSSEPNYQYMRVVPIERRYWLEIGCIVIGAVLVVLGSRVHRKKQGGGDAV